MNQKKSVFVFFTRWLKGAVLDPPKTPTSGCWETKMLTPSLMVSMLLSTSVKKFSVSRMRDFSLLTFISPKFAQVLKYFAQLCDCMIVAFRNSAGTGTLGVIYLIFYIYSISFCDLGKKIAAVMFVCRDFTYALDCQLYSLLLSH